MDKTLTPAPSYEDGRSGTVVVFLSLFLLVLAFFIVLVTISTVEKTRSQAVMSSVTATFTPFERAPDKHTDFTAKEGDVLAANAFQEKITGAFATQLQVAKVKVVKPGQLMRADLPAETMFAAGEARIRDSVLPFMDRVVAALGGRPPGLRFDLEFVIGVPAGTDGLLPAGQTLEMARLGAFARRMTARGVPPDSIAVGLMPGDPGRIAMRFYVRRSDEARRELLRRHGSPG